MVSRLARASRKVEADVAVAEASDVRREKASTAAEVGEHCPGTGGRWNQRRAGGGYPMQHRESAVRSPPLGAEHLVLSDVVARQCERHTKKCYTQGDDRAHSARYGLI
jgi:hypothetical protein